MNECATLTYELFRVIGGLGGFYSVNEAGIFRLHFITATGASLSLYVSFSLQSREQQEQHTTRDPSHAQGHILDHTTCKIHSFCSTFTYSSYGPPRLMIMSHQHLQLQRL